MGSAKDQAGHLPPGHGRKDFAPVSHERLCAIRMDYSILKIFATCEISQILGYWHALAQPLVADAAFLAVDEPIA